MCGVLWQTLLTLPTLLPLTNQIPLKFAHPPNNLNFIFNGIAQFLKTLAVATMASEINIPSQW